MLDITPVSKNKSPDGLTSKGLVLYSGGMLYKFFNPSLTNEFRILIIVTIRFTYFLPLLTATRSFSASSKYFGLPDNFPCSYYFHTIYLFCFSVWNLFR